MRKSELKAALHSARHCRRVLAERRRRRRDRCRILRDEEARREFEEIMRMLRDI